MPRRPTKAEIMAALARTKGLAPEARIARLRRDLPDIEDDQIDWVRRYLEKESPANLRILDDHEMDLMDTLLRTRDLIDQYWNLIEAGGKLFDDAHMEIESFCNLVVPAVGK